MGGRGEEDSRRGWGFDGDCLVRGRFLICRKNFMRLFYAVGVKARLGILGSEEETPKS